MDTKPIFDPSLNELTSGFLSEILDPQRQGDVGLKIMIRLD